jgi:hypothetical protein
MGNLLKTGLTYAWNQPFAVCALFVYNLLWGLTLYDLVRSVAVPLLHRYPGTDLSRDAVQLFWIEGQFQIMKTDLVHTYVWWGLALLLARMLLTPLLNAGVYYSLEHPELNAGYRFIKGIRNLGLAFLGLYAIQMLLTLAPLYLLVPNLIDRYSKHASLSAIAWDLLPIIGGYLVYIFLVQTMFMYMQFGRASGTSSTRTLGILFRHGVLVLLLAFIVLVITLAITVAVMTSAMVWAGFAALAGIQAYRLLHMFCKMWSITSQYALWNAKNN